MVLIGWAFSLIAQPHVNWINYSFSQRVTDIDIDSDYLWISTQGGLVKYNKNTGEKLFYNRANSNLPDNNLLGVFCADNGDVWVSSKYYGIGKFNNSNCTIYNQSNSGLPSNLFNTKVKLNNNGNIWVASLRWIAKYDGAKWKKWITGSDLSAFPIVSDFDIAKDGTVWIYSTDGIGKIEKDEYTIVSTIGSGLIAKNGFVKVDDEGAVWIAIEDDGIYKYDGSSFINYNTTNSCLPTNLIYAIDFDSDNKMWLATNIGLVLFNSSSCEFYPPDCIDKSLLSLKCDENGSIWCGTLNGKLLKFNGSTFSSFDISNSPLKSNGAAPLFNDVENKIWVSSSENTLKNTSTGLYTVYERSTSAAILNKNGDIWIGFNKGDTCLLKIASDKTIVFDSLNSPFNTKTNVVASSFAFDKIGNLWISSRYNGLFKYDGEDFFNFTSHNCDIPSNEVTDLAFDKNNNLWGGSARGLFKFDGENWTVWDTANSAIPTNLVNTMTISLDSIVWFSCMDENRIIGNAWGGGLTKFDGQTMTTYNIHNSGLLSNTIMGILDDIDKLWITTIGSGLMRFDKSKKWEAFNVTNSGIASNDTQHLLKDKNGSIWIGHINAGISIYNPDSAIQTINGINDKTGYDIDSKLLIYPNPVKNELFVRINISAEKITQAKVYDIYGRLIQVVSKELLNKNRSIYSFKIASNLPDNQILLLILIAENGNLFSGRFLISK